MENIRMVITTLLVFVICAVVEETLGTFVKYSTIAVTVEKLLELGVASKNYSAATAIYCAMQAMLSGTGFLTLCVHSTSGQCLLLNSTYPALFNRTYPSSKDYNCYIREPFPRSIAVAPPCPASFDWVADVGCVLVVEYGVTYDVAKASCPGGSQLVSLYADNFLKLTAYVYEKSLRPRGFSTGWYIVGLQRNNIVWTWRTGQVMSGLPGSGFWGSLEPNDNSDCAFLQFSNGAFYLGDMPCNTGSFYVCALQ
ncbi:uncharacterized protein LOC108680834 [Hyalella azteca]|uniref:Uncharacterized protein LOC108680834 n=1 Tax=Hyalella azteca TaxID=294128 RepID=A0A8B7PI85_HYAAZ|nr:uncharacterized protein LOC108680834 [Hyalella azteca]